jgi:hypothetical protein
MIDYGDELMIQTKIIDEHIQTTMEIDNDHAQSDGMCQVFEKLTNLL